MRIRKDIFEPEGGLNPGPEGIAIVGMACLFPGAPDLDEYWRNIEHGIDAISEVPSDRWDPVYYDPKATDIDRFYCRRGGFIDAHASFDPLAFGVMPVAAEGAEPDQLLGLQVAARALADAGYEDRSTPRDRAGVILGRGGYIGARMTRLNDHVRTAQQLVECLRALVPSLGEKELEEIRAEYRAQLGYVGPDSVIGLVPNLAASRIANRLDLKGPAYTVDAACASSLVAVDHACRELRDRRCDLMLAGGVHLVHDPTFWSVFCQLGALSRNQQIRPFDKRADGLLIGEGIGIVVLKRYYDAMRDNDRVYAVIRGTGVASDGRDASLFNPRIDGQLLALQRAWDDSRLDPKTLGLLEAHGTATPVGDATELSTIARFFGGKLHHRAVIGSVKSQIGHTMPAAGAAGLIKAALACYHGVLPPTLHCEEPSDKLENTGFRPLKKAEPWDENGGYRRAAVNAFGFGGINAHIILDASPKEQTGRVFLPTGKHRLPPQRTTLPEDVAERMLFLAAKDIPTLLAKIDDRDDAIGEGPCRLVLVDPTPERRQKARKIVEKAQPARSGRDGIMFTPTGFATEGGKLALLYPGVDASFKPRVEDLAAYFKLPLPTHIDGGNLESIGMGIIGVGRLMQGVFAKIGVKPDMVAGHSIGEWSGMIATGMVSEDNADRFIDSLVPGTLEVPGVVFAAVGCGEEMALDAIEGLPDIAISHDNCPHQILLCGREDSVDEALRRLLGDGVLCQKLAFRSGFHSPLFGPWIEPYRKHFERITVKAAHTPLYSATTCAPYPNDEQGIRTLAMDHLIERVRFRELIDRMYDDGARMFVQAGTGSLVGFVGDTLRGKPHLVVTANTPQRSGLAQLHRTAAALWVEGVSIDLARLPMRRNKPAQSAREIVLPLGVPLPRISKELAVEARTGGLDDVAGLDEPVMRELALTLREMQRAKDDVMTAYRAYAAKAAERAAAPKPLGPRELTRRLRLSLESNPELIDHTFYRQPPNWPNPGDRFPIVPMTQSIMTMVEIAHELVPEMIPIAVERVRALRWIPVEPPIELVVNAKFDGDKRVDVSIEGYASASIRFGHAYPAAPKAVPMQFEAERPSEVNAHDLYAQHLMFHGPKFQGVIEMGMVGKDGMRGVLKGMPTKGALLDNAGQIYGHLISLKTERDRLALPFRVDRLTFYGPEPEPDTRVDCSTRILQLTEQMVRGDIELSVDGTMWCHIEGWEDRRFETDPYLDKLMQYPEREVYARARAGGYVLAPDIWRSSASRDLLSRRYLSQSEREHYERVPLKTQRGFLLGRIAIKDAVRAWLVENGTASIFPIEVTVANEPSGRPYVRGPFTADVRVSVAHKDQFAVAVIGIGHDVGIDIERVERRGADFESITFTAEELAILPKNDRDLWVTRFWVAKEAVAKARGTGLMGAPRRFVVSEIAGDCLRVGDLWVETYLEDGYVVGVTRVL